MNDYDCRQLRLMLMQISAYENGKVDMSGLISNLEVLHHVLQEVPESWRDKFWSEWSILEEVYSIAIDREQPIESPANRAETIPAITRIKDMIVELLNGANPQEDA